MQQLSINNTKHVPHAEHSSRPHPLTGEKREATEHTEQGETCSQLLCWSILLVSVSPCSSPQETSVRGTVREENGLRTCPARLLMVTSSETDCMRNSTQIYA